MNITANPTLTHCCVEGCNRSLIVGERRKRLRYGAQAVRGGVLLRFCLKCCRKYRKDGTLSRSRGIMPEGES